MSKRHRVIVGLVTTLLSLWAGAGVITLLPDGTVALHTAAILSALMGVVFGIVLVINAMDS